MLDLLNKAINQAKNTNMYSGKLKDLDLIFSLKDFLKIPFTTKSDLREAYPYGTLAVNFHEVVEVHMTSGTTGKPTLSFFTKSDLLNSNEYISKAWKNFGIDKSSKIQFMMSYGLFSGAPLNSYAIQHIGGFVMPSGIQPTQKQVELLRDFQIDIIVATPSYFLHLYDFLQKNKIPLASLNIRKGIAAGEAYSDEMKAKIAKMFNIRLYDHYGLCEVNTGIIYECDKCEEMVVLKDYVYAEVVDPQTGVNLAIGETGELVLTATMKDASPILRYKTGDAASIVSYSSDCTGCKGSMLISRIKGRIDSIIFYKGLKIDPYELKDFVFIISEDKIYNRIKIIVNEKQDQMSKTITIRVSTKPGVNDFAFKVDLEKNIQEKIKVPVRVELVSYDYFEEFNTTKVKLVEHIYE